MAKEKDYFKTFCKVSKAFGTTLSREKLLDLIVRSAVDIMEAKAACLFLADEEKDIFIPVAQIGLSDKYLHASPMQAKKIVQAILNGGHLYIKDATTDPRLENHEEKKAEGIASILDVPVMVKDKAIGITLPNFVDLTVTKADPWLKGDSVSGDSKPITVETGYSLRVPPFIQEGDKITIDTRNGEYVTRVKE